MALKETPINTRQYFKILRDECMANKEHDIELRDDLLVKSRIKLDEIKENIFNYEITYHINLLDYEEFAENKYITGKFYKLAKGLMINRKNDYELVSDLYDLYDLASLQKNIYELEKEIELYDKILNLSIKEYTEILRVYYTEVHKQLILNGYGYSLGKLGWICVNRAAVKSKKKMLDFSATKKREKELKEQGIKIYNKDEAEWCKKNGIEYKAADKRVFKNDEYCYEIPLIHCKLGANYKLTITDYRHTSIRGKTNDDLIKECNNDTKKICELPIDLKTKVTLCTKVDKILYTKFIRNENQESVVFGSFNRKDRQ